MERDRKRDGNREAKEESEKDFPAVRWDFPGVLALLAPRFDCVMLDFALLFPVSAPALALAPLSAYFSFPLLDLTSLRLWPGVKFSLAACVRKGGEAKRRDLSARVRKARESFSCG